MQWLRRFGMIVILAGLVLGTFGETGIANAQQTSCVRGKFKNYHNEGQTGVIPAGYNGRVFKLRQDYPDTLPPKEIYPWLAIGFNNGAPSDPVAYLEAMKNYYFEGNWEVDWDVEKNTVRKWYHMPWLDYTKDGREFVRGLTHELDLPAGTLGPLNTGWTNTWAVAMFNDRASWGLGQVWCNPDAPNPDMLNPDQTEPNWFPEGAFIGKLLFNNIPDEQAPYMKGGLVWEADQYAEVDPAKRTPAEDPTRKLGPVRLLQVDLSVRDNRSPTGWLMGSYTYDGRQAGDDPIAKLEPIGIQWGNDPGITPEMVKAGYKLKEVWINDAIRDLPSNHLGYAGRLAGPLDSSTASCMSCHLTAGYPQPPILSLAYPDPTGPNPTPWPNQHQLAWFVNLPAGSAWSYDTKVSQDYSLQLPMGYQNFLRAKKDADAMKEEKFSPRGPDRDAPADEAPKPSSFVPPWLGSLVVLGAFMGVGGAVRIRKTRKRK